jgi:hypothetical protein
LFFQFSAGAHGSRFASSALSSNQLVGPIPSTIGELKALSYLYVVVV